MNLVSIYGKVKSIFELSTELEVGEEEEKASIRLTVDPEIRLACQRRILMLIFVCVT